MKENLEGKFRIKHSEDFVKDLIETDFAKDLIEIAIVKVLIKHRGDCFFRHATPPCKRCPFVNRNCDDASKNYQRAVEYYIRKCGYTSLRDYLVELL